MTAKFGTTIVPSGAVGEDDMAEILINPNRSYFSPIHPDYQSQTRDGRGIRSNYSVIGMVRDAKSHRILKDMAMNRVDDLQVMFMDLQSARKESRNIDMVVFEEQVHRMLKEWKRSLTSRPLRLLCISLQFGLGISFAFGNLMQGGSLGSFPPDISRLLQLCDEEDDVTSGLAAPKPDPDAHNTSPNSVFHNANFVATPIWFISSHSNICPPPSAFLGPKCALWDCPRPAQGWWSERPVQWWCTSYCSSPHAVVAQNEGQPGMTPVIWPKGIELKDNLLFAAFSAKAQGKNVGVPVCEVAATTKSPWNAPELFDLSVFEGEMLHEWLFFEKPRRAFESGNRKQRSLPDYNGWGWHESRKQVINESGWLKRSYYMDPQPMKFLEWHLYEYEINKYDACALYRLELKLVDRNKNPKDLALNGLVINTNATSGEFDANCGFGVKAEFVLRES
ncbi:hypothetical protein L1987_59358 [Smallanthus sonchifolius]|uniref:Uncharacterized protein n=1 Tax=Smallanthus sonchifolius TaxID=185202 RepID=A0ACB9D509_9ASTR|nr:hypothetical protein L1987_59358 [Smallanthus sonchifolius]